MVPTETTVRDLQNARHILAAAGHAQGVYLETGAGSVCLSGAIRLATTHRLALRPLAEIPALRHVLLYTEERLPNRDVSLQPRRRAAIHALSRVLPDTCSDPTHIGSCILIEHHPEAVIWHFNDYICQGGTDADDILREAIEKLQAG